MWAFVRIFGPRAEDVPPHSRDGPWRWVVGGRHGFAPWPHLLVVCPWFLPRNQLPDGLTSTQRAWLKEKKHAATRERRRLDTKNFTDAWELLMLSFRLAAERFVDQTEAAAAAADDVPLEADVPLPLQLLPLPF